MSVSLTDYENSKTDIPHNFNTNSSAGPLGWWLSARHVLKRDPSNSLDHPSLRYGSQDDRYTKLCYSRNHNHTLHFCQFISQDLPTVSMTVERNRCALHTIQFYNIRVLKATCCTCI